MSGSGPDRRAGYTLISQSNSDNSELSDEELRSFSQDGFQIITIKGSFNPDFSQKTRTSNNCTYRGLMNLDTEEIKINHVFPSERREITSSNRSIMSTKRKFSFGFSIFMCIFTITLFLMVPCEWANCSCDSTKNVTYESWLNIITSIELGGPVILVRDFKTTSTNILLLAHGSIFSDAPVMRTNYTSSYGGDIFALDGTNGNVIWRKHFNKMPNEIDCTLLNLKNRLMKDCIIVSYGNYVAMISSEKGRIYWNLPLNTKNIKMKEVFPLIVPDYNNDTVKDLLILTDINKISLVSGISGSIIKGDYRNISQNCSEIGDIHLNKEMILKISCVMENNVSELEISLKNASSPVEEHEFFSQHYTNSSNRIKIRNYIIEIMNEGTLCPKMCNTSITIKNLNKKSVWTHESESSYTLQPDSFDFNNSLGLYGFIIKIWEYDHEGDHTKKLRMGQDDVKLIAHFLYERTIIVIFNTSDYEPIQTINMSYFPIIQLYSAEKSVQPDPVSQQNSLSIVDIGQNGTLQLLTYYSTFEEDVRNSFSHTNYLLKSYVRTYLLENEIIRHLN